MKKCLGLVATVMCLTQTAAHAREVTVSFFDAPDVKVIYKTVQVDKNTLVTVTKCEKDVCQPVYGPYSLKAASDIQGHTPVSKFGRVTAGFNGCVAGAGASFAGIALSSITGPGLLVAFPAGVIGGCGVGAYGAMKATDGINHLVNSRFTISREDASRIKESLVDPVTSGPDQVMVRKKSDFEDQFFPAKERLSEYTYERGLAQVEQIDRMPAVASSRSYQPKVAPSMDHPASAPAGAEGEAASSRSAQ